MSEQEYQKLLLQVVNETREDVRHIYQKVDRIEEQTTKTNGKVADHEKRLCELEQRGDNRMRRANDWLALIRNIGIIIAAVVGTLWAVFKLVGGV
jgi:predicted nuclease with TOPRIM domain